MLAPCLRRSSEANRMCLILDFALNGNALLAVKTEDTLFKREFKVSGNNMV
jgi:hypothetical protein